MKFWGWRIWLLIAISHSSIQRGPDEVYELTGSTKKRNDHLMKLQKIQSDILKEIIKDEINIGDSIIEHR
jgi:hypothetical protein